MEDSGFKKIELTSSANRVTHEQDMKKNRIHVSKNKRVFVAVMVIVLLLLGFLAFLGFKARIIYQDGQKAYQQVKLTAAAFKQQNIVQAKEETVKTQDQLNVLKKDLDSISFVRFIPPFSFYYNDAVHLVNASSHGVSAGITVVDTLIPYADVLGLKGKGSFVGGSAEQRIQTAVKTLDKIIPKIDEVEKDLIAAKEEIDMIDPNHYPKISRLKNLHVALEQAKAVADEGVTAIQEAKPLIKVLPELLGEPDPKRYLVLFQNDKELRPTGGFMTFYAIFKVEQGVIRVESASDIYNLDASISIHPKAPDIILKFLPKVSTLNIRDSNLSPDFVVSMDAFNNLYEKSSQKVKVDGIIGLDTHVLVDTLDILGEVQAGGLTFNTSTDPRCDCPQVVYILEANADKPVGEVKENRKALIGDLLFAIMKKALSSSPGQYWGRLFQQALKDAEEKHILMYIYNKDAQTGIETLNFAGRIKQFEGDYLHINDSNFGGAKSNMYVKQSVKVEYEVNSNGKITKTLTIDYKNPHSYSDCNLERGGLCLNAILRDYLRIYVPHGSSLDGEVRGSEVKVTEGEDLGKTVFESFLTVKPEGQSQIIFKYTLPFKYENNKPLPVLVQKQPGTDGVPYEIYVNGKKTDSFVLNADKVLNLKIN